MARQITLFKYGEINIIFYFRDISYIFDGGINHLLDLAAFV